MASTDDNTITGTEISALTGDSKSRRTSKTQSTTGTGSTSSKHQRNQKWGPQRKSNGNPAQMNHITFKGANADLKGKVFVKGALQAAKYDEAYKAILNHIGAKFDHRVYKAFEYKDRTKGINLLIKPRPPMINKVVQFATMGEDSVLVGREVSVIDKDCEEYIEYQLYLKQYMTDLTKFNDNLEKCYSLLIGQCPFS